MGADSTGADSTGAVSPCADVLAAGLNRSDSLCADSNAADPVRVAVASTDVSALVTGPFGEAPAIGVNARAATRSGTRSR